MTDDLADDLAVLEAAAAKATPGEWYDMARVGWRPAAGGVRAADGRTLRYAVEDKGDEAAANAAHIAAAHPARVLRVVAECRRLRAEVETQKAANLAIAERLTACSGVLGRAAAAKGGLAKALARGIVTAIGEVAPGSDCWGVWAETVELARQILEAPAR